jgi:hypothetical protein
MVQPVLAITLLSGPTVTINQPPATPDPFAIQGAALLTFSGVTTSVTEGDPDVVTSMEYQIDTSFPVAIQPDDATDPVPFATWSFDLLIPAVRVANTFVVKVTGYTADNRPSAAAIRNIKDLPIGPGPAPKKAAQAKAAAAFAPDLHVWPSCSTARVDRDVSVELRLFSGDASATRVQLGHFVRPEQDIPFWDKDLFPPDLLQNVPNPVLFRPTIRGLHSLVLQTRTPGSPPTYEVFLIQVLG